MSVRDLRLFEWKPCCSEEASAFQQIPGLETGHKTSTHGSKYLQQSHSQPQWQAVGRVWEGGQAWLGKALPNSTGQTTPYTISATVPINHFILSIHQTNTALYTHHHTPHGICIPQYPTVQPPSVSILYIPK